MKYKIRIEVDTETNEYEIGFNNLSKPGESIDYRELRSLLKKILDNFDSTINEDINSDERVTKYIH